MSKVSIRFDGRNHQGPQEGITKTEKRDGQVEKRSRKNQSNSQLDFNATFQECPRE